MTPASRERLAGIDLDYLDDVEVLTDRHGLQTVSVTEFDSDGEVFDMRELLRAAQQHARNGWRDGAGGIVAGQSYVVDWGGELELCRFDDQDFEDGVLAVGGHVVRHALLPEGGPHE